MSYALPTLKTVANRVLRECAIPEVSSFNPGNRQSTIAYDSVLDAYADIWMRNRWEWQRYEASIALQEGVDEYPLPANFQRMAVSPWFGPQRNAFQLNEMSPEEFYDAIANVDVTQRGTPLNFTIDHTTIKLFPTPGSTTITASPNLTYQYWMGLPQRKALSEEADPLDYIPLEFYDALVCYAKAKTKQYLEFPDFERDMQIYEKKLAILWNRGRQIRKAPRMRTAFDGVREW